jgi:hypothetical protein
MIICISLPRKKTQRKSLNFIFYTISGKIVFYINKRDTEDNLEHCFMSMPCHILCLFSEGVNGTDSKQSINMALKILTKLCYCTWFRSCFSIGLQFNRLNDCLQALSNLENITVNFGRSHRVQCGLPESRLGLGLDCPKRSLRKYWGPPIVIYMTSVPPSVFSSRRGTSTLWVLKKLLSCTSKVPKCFFFWFSKL